MGIQDALEGLEAGRDLMADEAAAVTREIIAGEIQLDELERFASALRAKGETADELAAMAVVLRETATPLKLEGPLLDTSGTGGDDKHSFNLSTAAALIAAAAGARVAKLHDAAVTSRCGSTELLDALGIASSLPSEAAARCFDETGICFLSAPQVFANAYRLLEGGEPRSEARALIHLLALLAHPAQPRQRVVGVADARRAEAVTDTLAQLGVAHALVVSGSDGMDEITPTGTTTAYELVGSAAKSWSISPPDVGVDLAPRHAILGGPPAENKLIAEFLLRGKASAYADYAELNAAAALLASDRVASLKEGFELALDTVKSGAARRKLDDVIEVSQGLRAAV
jgi:anthranilate phosphoribosyltransferase